jgi:glycine/D-amino acid oxidase-like deaminating enzyme
MKPLYSDYLIIGAGIFGSVLSYELSRRVAGSITLIEARMPGGGLTQSSPGLVALHDKVNPNSQYANYASSYYRQLDQVFKGACELKTLASKWVTADNDESFLSLQVNARQVCQLLVTAAIKNKLNYVSAPVQCLQRFGACQTLVTTPKNAYYAPHVIVACGVKNDVLVKNNRGVCVNKLFRANIYSRQGSAASVAVHQVEDLYIIPWGEHVVTGFISKDEIEPYSTPVEDPRQHSLIHQVFSQLYPEFASKKYQCRSYQDNFSPNNQAVIEKVPGSGLYALGGASGNGITQAPQFIDELLTLFP